MRLAVVRGTVVMSHMLDSLEGKRMAIVLEDVVDSAPVINEPITGGNASITMGGNRTRDESVKDANQLALVLKSGANSSGLVKSETADELVLDSPEDGKLTVKKADIVKRQRGLSAMPEGLDKLMTRRELRDLVEYLSTLK